MKYSYIRKGPVPNDRHYLGWGYIMDKLIDKIELHKNGVVLDTWVDLPIKEDREHFNLLNNNHWIGILHSVVNTDMHFNLDRFLSSKLFQSTKSKCIALITTSEHTRKYVQSKTHIPVHKLLFAKPEFSYQFDLDAFLSDPQLRYSGSFGRDLKKLIAFNSSIPKLISCEEGQIDKQVLSCAPKSIIFNHNFLDHESYIQLLTRTIGFSYYWDCSASNAILEHIKTHTPLITNRLPAIEEYLGKDYPMYLDQIIDKPDKFLKDKTFLQDVSDYLKEASQKEEFSLEYFHNFLINFKV